MCGILAILLSQADQPQLRKRALALSSKLRHRGPDWSGLHLASYKENSSELLNVLAHQRLSIIDPDGGAQPIISADEKVALAVNGEIYNHMKLRDEFPKYNFRTGSDCEPIIPLYQAHGDAFVDRLDGVFAFVISNSEANEHMAARDAIGVCPMYVGWGRDGSVWFASELKAIAEECERFQEFPPGHYWRSQTQKFVRWHIRVWLDEHYLPTTALNLAAIRDTFERAVIKRLMTDVPAGILLSGGLDSSLVAAVVTRYIRRTSQSKSKHLMAALSWWPVVHSFSVGLEGSPDLLAARKVSNFLGTVHHEFHFTTQDGIDAIRDVIYHLETYDVTTIRASTPMFLMSRKIKASGVKMVISGEGADEMFGGYLYFHKAPSPAAFQAETIRKLGALSKYDCLRANKSTSAWGVEVRVPFLDKEFLDLAMTIDPAEKMINLGDAKTNPKDRRIEKYILRKAFDDPDEPYLPDSVLWRQKEQFSDGVGYQWIDGLKAHAEHEITDTMLAQAPYRFPYNSPTTKEAYLYRSLFVDMFPQQSACETVPGGPSIACSTPTAIEWDASWKAAADPSGRAIAGVHVQANK